MGHYENIKIDRSENWKYQTTLGTSFDNNYARVYVDDNGNISKDSYSREYNKKLEDEDSKGNDEKPDKNGKGDKDNDKNGKGDKGNEEKDEKKEGCLAKILKAPFRLLWWLTKFILKNALVILTFGILNGWFDKDKD